jgi:hypothetical protein
MHIDQRVFSEQVLLYNQLYSVFETLMLLPIFVKEFNTLFLLPSVLEKQSS